WLYAQDSGQPLRTAPATLLHKQPGGPFQNPPCLAKRGNSTRRVHGNAGRPAAYNGLPRTRGCPGVMEQPFIIAKSALGGGIALSAEERARHVYIVGKSGSGKSTVLFNLAMHDICAGEGVAVLDPHGDLAEALINAVPASRTHEVCYL